MSSSGPTITILTPQTQIMSDSVGSSVSSGSVGSAVAGSGVGSVLPGPSICRKPTNKEAISNTEIRTSVSFAHFNSPFI